MGGRIYDSHIGRFLQADPFVQSPSNSQNFNRYSYVLNNPLSYTDPTGYLFSKLWKEIKPFVGAIVAVVGTIMCPYCSPMLIGALAGAAGAAANGGNILKGAVIGAFSAHTFGAVGQQWAAGTFANVVGNAVAGGLMNSLQGGKFGHGFWAAGFSAAFKTNINKIGSAEAAYAGHRIVAAAVVGGKASKISGGKFANGAVTGAFSQAFNAEKQLLESRNRIDKILKLIDLASNGNDAITIYGSVENIQNAVNNAKYNNELMFAAGQMSNDELAVFFPEYFDKYKHPAMVKYHLLNDYGNNYKDAFQLGHSIVGAGLEVGTIALTGRLPASIGRALFLLEVAKIDYTIK